MVSVDALGVVIFILRLGMKSEGRREMEDLV